MKFKSFRNLIIGGATTAGLAGGGYVVMSDDAEPSGITDHDPVDPDTVELPVVEPVATLPTRPSTPDPAATAMTGDVDPVREYLVAKLGKPGRGKVKDGLGAGNAKINVYAEGGVFVRAKVDLDRDEQWDEKWSWKNGNLSVQRSTKDDGSYDVEQALDTQGAPEAATPTPVEASAPGMRAVDNVILAAREKPMTTKKRKDVTKGKAFKVNLYSDDGSTLGRAKVDLDRDDKWDEKWTLKSGSVERQVSPKDNEDYSETWELTKSGWKKK